MFLCQHKKYNIRYIKEPLEKGKKEEKNKIPTTRKSFSCQVNVCFMISWGVLRNKSKSNSS